MAVICATCGHALPAGQAFCAECGAPAPAPAAAGFAPPPPTQERFAPQPPAAGSYVPPPPAQEMYAPPRQSAPAPSLAAPPAGKVSTGYYFGMMLLYALPVIGFIVCIITACAGKNRSKKNFARAVLIWMIIGLVLSAALFFVCSWVAEAVVTYFQQSVAIPQAAASGFGLPTGADGLGDLLGILDSLKGGQ